MDGPDGRWSDDLRAVHAACAHWATDVRPEAGGSHLAGTPLPLALTDATWLPLAERLAELGEAPAPWPALVLPPGDVAEPTAREAGYRPTLEVAIADPWGASRRPGRVTVHDGAPVGWDAAADVATVIVDSALQAEAAEEERTALTEALATVLASAASDDPDVELHLTGDVGLDRAAAVSIRTEGARTIVLSGGEAEPLVATLLDEAHAVGRRAYWARLASADDVVAVRRWERTP
ncbi:MAG: hypothetical protein U5J97_05375 [Trueperaceae bacterium]|nr:hypothetical protein [Trueperaceae bacterium]